MSYLQDRVLFTIGHSNHSLDAFLALLGRHGIDLLVDVRSRPYSGYCPHFNIGRFRKAMEESGIGYLFLGRELGGMPDSDEFYDDEGYVLYYRLAATAFFLDGISRLEESVSESRVAIMCGEENPAACHRRLLVGSAVQKRGVKLLHIRKDGGLQTDEELPGSGRTCRNESLQPGLFELPCAEGWKSMKPVRPKRR